MGAAFPQKLRRQRHLLQIITPLLSLGRVTMGWPVASVNRLRSATHLLPLLMLLLAFGIRATTLGWQSLWFDEGWSWHLARMPLVEMAGTTAADRSPALYYGLLHIWRLAGGETEFALRTLSLFADIATCALVMALSARLGIRPMWLAGLLYALNPVAIWYAQETRMYAQVSALTTASTLALWIWLGRPRLRILIASAACLGAAIHSHYYAIFVVPAHALLVAAVTFKRTPKQALHWTVAMALVAATVVPWLLAARGGFAYDDGFAFPLNTIDGRMSEWLRWFAAGSLPLAVDTVMLGVTGLAIGIALARLILARHLQPALSVLMLTLIPLLAATIAVRLFYPYRSVFHPRYLIYLVPVLTVLLAGAAAAFRQPRRSAIPGGLALAALLGGVWLPQLGGYLQNPALQRDDTRGATQHVVEALVPGDLIVMSRDNFAVTYYTRNQPALPIIALPAGLHGVLRDPALALDAINARTPSRVRLLLWQDDVVDPQRIIETSLRGNGYQIGEYNFGQIRLPLYQIEQQPLRSITLRDRPARFTAPNGDVIRLTRFWLRPISTAGDWVYALLEWQVDQTPAANYKVFVHVLNTTGAIVAQQDKLTLSDLLPTSTWTPGTPLRDPYAMIAPADLPAGDYQVRIGLYAPDTGIRLQTDGGDMIDLGTLTVRRR
jgi:mannosyltransferase